MGSGDGLKLVKYVGTERNRESHFVPCHGKLDGTRLQRNDPSACLQERFPLEIAQGVNVMREEDTRGRVTEPLFATVLHYGHCTCGATLGTNSIVVNLRRLSVDEVVAALTAGKFFTCKGVADLGHDLGMVSVVTCPTCRERLLRAASVS